MSKQSYITKGYVDIHAHLLPVQDGPESQEEALNALRLASDTGIEHMVLTPHYFSNDRSYKKAVVERAYERLRQEVERAQIPIKIYLGNELSIDQNVIASLRNQQAMTLADSEYVLAEYPFYQVPCNYGSIVYELMSQGYRPIIAHPERNAFIQSGYESLVELKSLGCLIQINAASLLGDYGGLAKKYAQRILGEGLADFIASDAHSYVQRPPDVISHCLKKLHKLSDGYVESLLRIRAQETILSENNRLSQEID